MNAVRVGMVTVETLQVGGGESCAPLQLNAVRATLRFGGHGSADVRSLDDTALHSQRDRK